MPGTACSAPNDASAPCPIAGARQSRRRVGILEAQRPQQFALARLHRRRHGFGHTFVLVALRVQRAVHQQVGVVGVQRNPLFGRLGPLSIPPGLQLEHIPFGVCDIAPRNPAPAGHRRRHDLSDRPASGLKHCGARRRHVRHAERQVTETGPVYRGRRPLREFFVGKNLHRRPVVLVSRQAEVDAAQVCASQPGPGLRLRQVGCVVSTRSVERIIADYGLQKKTLQMSPPRRRGA